MADERGPVKPTGKATELDRRLEAESVEHQAKMEARRRQRPELQLKPDAVAEVTDETPVKQVLGQLAADGARSVELRDAQGGSTGAVVVPIDHYVELVAKVLANENKHLASHPGPGRLSFQQEHVAGLDIELADPARAWHEVWDYRDTY